MLSSGRPPQGWKTSEHFPGSNSSEAQAINNNGQVVGFSANSAGSHAFLWTRASGMQDLGVLPGDTESKARGISDSGQVIGWSVGSGGTRAFVLDQCRGNAGHRRPSRQHIDDSF